MPISKNGKLYFEKEDIEKARRYSALQYAQERKYDLVRTGVDRYTLREHDSMVFRGNGNWYWNSRDVHGRALEFLIQYEGYSFLEAVQELLMRDHAPVPQPEAAPPPKPPFVLPARAATQRHLFAYLCETRGLDESIVKSLIRDGRLYQGCYTYKGHDTGEARQSYNAVFVGLDDAGIPRSAFQRGLTSYSAFRCDVPSSDKLHCPFIVPGYPSTPVVGVFEAGIDAISHATLAKMRSMDYQSMERIVMGGISFEVVHNYLQRHPEKKEVHFCLDNDSPGLKGAEKIEQRLREAGCTEGSGYRYIHEQVPIAKDWNDALRYYKTTL